MKKYVIILLAACLLSLISVQSVFGQNQKLAQTGMKFLSVSMDARSSAMGTALTSLEGGSTALFYNPSGMSRLPGFMHVAFGRVNWIADINYMFGSFAINIGNGQYGVIGLSFMSVDYGDFKGTIRADNDQGFIDTGIFSPAALALGIGYARALSDKFSVGGHVRFVHQNLSGGVIDFTTDQSVLSQRFEKDILAFDFGILYKTGFRSLNFGMNVRNFSKEVKYVKESFQLPLTFEIGLSINMIDFFQINPEEHTVLLSVDAVHPRDFAEQIDFGIEYVFMQNYSLRFGFTSPTDEQGASFGAGILQKVSDVSMQIDYAYTPFGIFEDVHRFTFKFAL
jgi:hypothetical protein